MWFISSIILVLLFNAQIARSVDETRTKQAYGDDVVQATVRTVEDTCIFTNDFQFMRRLAYVETYFGKLLVSHWDTDAGNSGIWQVDQTAFQNVQQNLPSSIDQAVKAQLGVDIDSLNRLNGDLQVPMNDCLAAYSYISLLPAPIPLSLQDQAQYWQTYYNRSGTGTTQQFLNLVGQMPSLCPSAGADLLFILDSSGSIGADVFSNVRSFVATVVQNLTVGPSNFMIAVDDFSTQVQSVIQFNSYSSVGQLLQQIQNIPYYGENTCMGDALMHALQSFSQTQGARPASSGIPKIAVLITDGEPNCGTDTATAAEKLKASGVELYTVGVGPSVNPPFLATLASPPVCMHSYLVNNYADLAAYFPDELKSQTCQSLAVVLPNTTSINNTITQNQTLYFQFSANQSAGITFKVKSTSGSTTFFLANSTHYPSPVQYDYSCTSTVDFECQIFINTAKLSTSRIPSASTTVPVYGSLLGVDQSNSFVFTNDVGNTISAGS